MSVLKSTLLFALLGAACLLNQALAACSGCNQTINLSINKTLGLTDNVVGHTEVSTSFTISGVNTGFFGIFGAGYVSNSFSKIDGTLPPFGTSPTDWVYQPIDDYFAVAVRTRGACKTLYPPFNQSAVRPDTCQPGPTSGVYAPTTWDSSLKIIRPLINGTYANNVFLGRWGACLGISCSKQTIVIANIYLNYSITVPQTCVINAGQIVTVDFGNVSTGAFKTAGAKASGVTPIARNLGIKCNNIDAYANLSLRVQADNTAGNALVSTNKDVGFVITDGSDRPLTPNDFSSVLPFKLDGTTSANVTIKVYPVSVTGVKPAEGPVTSQGYLRIDFA
ncbi:fimbrial protein [Serratia sp. AKBS12]|uniref:fimbrial protein n=1 Tax=Serratia sp. AKBS12 TaxID=2974597 RepID=UPI002165C696|nr:fimbrial protein [Serratia sp. AKBS12]MCS3407311.1 fimbrial protein [Serratia sp. AKBS12]